MSPAHCTGLHSGLAAGKGVREVEATSTVWVGVWVCLVLGGYLVLEGFWCDWTWALPNIPFPLAPLVLVMLAKPVAWYLCRRVAWATSSTRWLLT